MFENQAQTQPAMPPQYGLGQAGTTSPPCQTLGQKLLILQDGTGDLLSLAGRLHALHFGAQPTEQKNAASPNTLHDVVSLLTSRVDQACNYLRQIEAEYGQQ